MAKTSSRSSSVENGKRRGDGGFRRHGVEVKEARLGRFGELEGSVNDGGVRGEQPQAAGAGLDADFAAFERVPPRADGEVKAVVLVQRGVLGGLEVDVERVGVLEEAEFGLLENGSGGRLGRVGVCVVVEEDAARVQAKMVDFVLARNDRLHGVSICTISWGGQSSLHIRWYIRRACFCLALEPRHPYSQRSNP